MKKIFYSLLALLLVTAPAFAKDKAVVKKYLDDPLVHDRLSVNMGIEILEAAKWLENFKGHVDMPILLMHADEDHLTAAGGSELLANNLDGDVTYREWAGMYHEIHNEPGQQEVFDYTIDWIEKKIGKWSEAIK